MIPNLFTKKPIPDKLPDDMLKAITRLKKTQTKDACIKMALSIISKRFRGCYIFQRFLDLFVADPFRLWETKGKSHCTNLNFLFRILLVKSGRFKEEDIKPKISLVWYFSPHQYFRIDLGEKEVAVDPWSYTRGMRFGDYANGFNLI